MLANVLIMKKILITITLTALFTSVNAQSSEYSKRLKLRVAANRAALETNNHFDSLFTEAGKEFDKVYSKANPKYWLLTDSEMNKIIPKTSNTYNQKYKVIYRRKKTIVKLSK